MFLTTLTCNLYSQDERCGFDELMKYHYDNGDSMYFEQNNILIYDYWNLEPLQNNSQTYELPVVIHVLHLPSESIGQGGNISDLQIHNALEKLNNDFTGLTANSFDTGIQFCLAERDPSGNATTGIVRVAIESSTVPNFESQGLVIASRENSNEYVLKSITQWPNIDYINIWIVPQINGNTGNQLIAGFAYFPGVNNIMDGIVIQASFFTENTTVASHEVGHYLALYHTFEGDCFGNCCPPDIPCDNDPTNDDDEICNRNIGDRCEDTPAHIRSAFDCLQDVTNPCVASGTSSDHNINFMDYSDFSCQHTFTADQKKRMEAILNTVRQDLLYSVGCLPPCPELNLNFSHNRPTNTATVGDAIIFTSSANSTISISLNGNLLIYSSPYNFTFNHSGSYIFCVQAENSNCKDRKCIRIEVNEPCETPDKTLINGDFSQYFGTPPLNPPNTPSIDFINNNLLNWSVTRATPDFYYQDPTLPDNSRFEYVFLTDGGGPFFNEEGVFACYPFEAGKTYKVCLDVYSPKTITRNLNIYCTNGLIKYSLSNSVIGDQLIGSISQVSGGWTEYSFTFVADDNYEFISLSAVAPPSGTIEGSRFYFDNIIVYPLFDDEGFEITEDFSICIGEPAFLLATGGTEYEWEYDPSLSCTDCPNPIAYPTQTTTYTVHIYYGYGGTCDKLVTKRVTVDLDCPDGCPLMPDFTYQSLDGCNYSFVGSNGGHPAEYIWNIQGGPKIEYQQSITHQFPFSGMYNVCLTVACDEFTDYTICKEIEVEIDENEEHCHICPDYVIVGHAQKCNNDDIYVLNFSLSVPKGFEPCDENELYFQNNQNYNTMSIESWFVDSRNQNYDYLYITLLVDPVLQGGLAPIDQFVLCGPDGEVSCHLVGWVYEDCDTCIDISEEIQAQCDDNNPFDDIYIYSGQIKLPYVQSAAMYCSSTSEYSGFESSMPYLDNGIWTVDFQILTDHVDEFNTNFRICFEFESYKTCYNITISITDPCDEQIECDYHFNDSPAYVLDCNQVVDGQAYFDFTHALFLPLFSQGFDICENTGLYMEGASSLELESSEIRNDVFYFDVEFMVPCDQIELNQGIFILEFFFCNEFAEVMCVTMELILKCNTACDINVVYNRSVLERKQSSQPSVLLYPNPGNSLLNIEVSGGASEMYFIQVFDGLIRECINREFHTNSMSLDVGSLASGIYFVIVRSAEERYLRKFIKVD
jgi:hypothetical protein